MIKSPRSSLYLWGPAVFCLFVLNVHLNSGGKSDSWNFLCCFKTFQRPLYATKWSFYWFQPSVQAYVVAESIEISGITMTTEPKQCHAALKHTHKFHGLLTHNHTCTRWPACPRAYNHWEPIDLKTVLFVQVRHWKKTPSTRTHRKHDEWVCMCYHLKVCVP